MSKLILDMSMTEERFFEDTAMIGIATSLPGYRLCWMLNEYFEIDFCRDPQKNIKVRRKSKNICYPVYHYAIPNTEQEYILYKLKEANEPLLPETKQLDYLWLVQTGAAEEDALTIAAHLKNIPDIQLSTMLDAEQLKNQINLLV